MADLPSATSGSPVISIRVTVRAPDLEAFIERYSQHIDGDRIFIFTKNPRPVGTRVRFTLQLANGEQLIHGNGTVTRLQEDVGDRRHPPGMELVFVPLDDRSQTLVDFLLASRAADAPPLIRAVSPQPPPLPPAPIGRGDSHGIETEPASPGVSVEVRSTPAGARVVLDGKPLEVVTPGTIEGLEAGKPCEVALHLDGHRPWSRKLRPRGGDQLFAMLVRIERILEISSDPPGAELFLDGRRIGVTPYTVRRLDRTKSHELELRLSGYLERMMRISPSDAFEPKGDAEVLTLAVKLEAEGAQPEAPPAPPDLPDPEEAIAVKIAEHLPALTSAPEIASGPAPAFVEKWREPLPPGPAPSSDGNVPANPFSEVSDGAIEYFVEWSLEQSVGPRADQSSKFFNVDMALPGTPAAAAEEPSASVGERAPSAWWRFALVFAAGVACGALPMLLLPRSTPAPLVAALPAAPSPPPVAEPSPNAILADVELRISTQPPGATLLVDGNPAGSSPLTLQVTAGKHEVVATKERYLSARGSVEAPGSLKLSLERPPATLHVVSRPAGAHVTIGGNVRGETPADLKLRAFETYEVVLQLDGSKPWRKSVYLRPPSAQLDATLVPVKAKPKPKHP